ncbi:DUF397 domain-containing protein [Nocardia sp. NPDC005978]|uniref:DUF397 domain-containing protein n=1 Tax=Nocardia sp. NPDC005978 TaxID=3156725 RepID=UPI0033BA64DD
MCGIEIRDNSNRVWFKSSRSNDGPNCVEVAFDGDLVLIRDSKYLRDPANDPARQPMLAVSGAVWAAFLAGVCEGEFAVAA